MIVLLVSLAEANALIAGHPDNALKQYIASELVLERVMPDENLPSGVLLRRLEVAERHYSAIIRTYETSGQADRAWTESEDDVVSAPNDTLF